MDDQTRKHEILAHYRQLWGELHHQQEFEHHYSDAPSPLHILEFPPSHDTDTCLYATLGASYCPLVRSDGTETARMELFIISEQPHAELADSLATLALYPFVHHTFLGEGHTILGTEGDGIVEGSPLIDILVARADFGDIPDYVEHSDGTHTHLFWIIPIYRQERLFAVAQGWKALLELFEQHGTNVLDLWRPSAVASP